MLQRAHTSEEESTDARERAFGLLERYGRATTSFQTLEKDFSYFFDGDDAFVAYKDTGDAWVAAGEPVAPRDRIAQVAERFVRAAREAGRRASFFSTEGELVEETGYVSTLVGEEPTWDPRRWDEVLRGSRKLREQLRRARAKGVTTRLLDTGEVLEGAPLRPRLDAVAAHWLETRHMAPMAFLVQVDPFARPEERRYVVAEKDGEPVALLVAVPIYARDGWLVEHVFREPDTPNGTTETLIDTLMRTVAAQGSRYVSLGLAPLSGELPWPLRAARRIGRGFYNFEGLKAFKARLHPDRWEPRYLARPPGRGAVRAILDSLAAFTPRGLWPFAVATLRHLGVPLVLTLWILLVPWTVMLAVASPGWFPSPTVKWAWVGFDVVLIGLMARLTRAWSRGLVLTLLSLVTLDAALTWTQAIAYNIPAAHGWHEWIVISAGLSGPTMATALFATLAGQR